MPVDFRSLCAYETPKISKIQDYRLGCLHFFLISAIILYVVLVEIWKDGGYLGAEQVVGTARYTLQEPTIDGCDPLESGCKLNLTSTRELAYCSQFEHSNSMNYTGNRYPCSIYDAQAITDLFDEAVVVTTRITNYYQDLVCNTSASTCPVVYNTSKTEAVYVVDVDAYTVLIDHTVQADSFGIYGSSRNLDAGLLSVPTNDGLCAQSPDATNARGKPTDSAPCFIKPHTTSKNLDYFPISVLLGAAGITLDDISYGDETYRETGVNMLLTIAYTNRKAWTGLSNISYVYKPTVLPASSFKLYTPEYMEYRGDRILLDKHGIRIEAIHSGSFYKWDYRQLLLTLTTSLTLLAVASVVVDKVMLYGMPQRKQYEECKYDFSVDFEDWREKQEARRKHNPKRQHEIDDGLAEPLVPRNSSVEEHSSYGGIEEA